MSPSRGALSALAIGVLLIVVGCGTGSTAPPTPAGPTAPYTIGYSNGGGVGNGFREEQVCTAKAQATALGASKIVTPLTIIHRDTDAAGQLADLRTLISQNVDAIVFNPNNPDALNPALAEAHAKGIVTVSVDAYVTDPNTWNLYNNQVNYAYLGAKWLFDKMGGTGKVWYTRGFAGHPADSDRDIGFKKALGEYPNISVFNEGGTFTQWDPAIATQITNDFIASGGYDQVQGIWASGMGAWIIDAIKGANKPFLPIADADIGKFVQELLDPVGYPNLVGAAVTNTASVGGAGVTLAYKLLAGETVQQSEGAGRPNTVLLVPQILDNTTEQGKTDLGKWIAVPNMDPSWPLSLAIPDWTTYDPNGVPTSCKGA
jgi:ribose transport system substrate-binding protein